MGGVLRGFLIPTVALVAVFFAFFATPAFAKPPSVASDSYILIDSDTGAVIAEKNADARLPPASLTKIMSAHLVFRALDEGRLSLSQSVRISPQAWAANVVGSKTFIEVDSDVGVRDLLYGLVVQSGNDAAIALAETLAGDESAFAARMNETAATLGLHNTHFANATGLTQDNHYSSARDVALLVQKTVRDYPHWYEIYRQAEFEYNGILQKNRNGLLKTFAGADGVKTGHTKAAGYCLAASALRDGRRLIAVVMKTDSPRRREIAAAKLLNYGFARTKNIHLFAADERRRLAIFGGAQLSVTVRPASDGLMTVARDAKPKTLFRPQNPLLAPLSKNDSVGVIEVLIGEKIALTVAVVADEDIDAAGFFNRLLDDIKINFLGHATQNELLSEW